ncbi:MAG: mucoidy inhibitor MuiA family protein [Methylobacterium sp.]|nr:mucoidy inhibitor MuiA family protein [Methylobacterium sp.]MCA3638963.1 mucoidy inhibitor MuiA family protein [Methylobacterium sp.]
MTTPRPASSLPPLGRALGLIAPLGLAAVPAHAATIEARSRIERVTLYPDAAIVTRSLSIDLPAGSHDVLLLDLPMTADPASLRVEASGNGRLMLGGIDLRLGVAEARADAELEARLKAKREARDRNADRMDSAETRKAMVQRLAQGDPAPKDGRPLDLESWLNAVDAVGKTTQALNDELRGLRIEEARIAEEIAALEAAIGQPGAQNPRRVAAIAVEAPEALRATLTVSYRVAGASWRPVYDARLDTRGAKPALELTRRALIRQRTGEDWREAKVVLSTLRVQRGTAAPVPGSERLGFHEPPPPRPLPMAAAPASDQLAMGEREERRQRMAAERMEPAEEREAQLATNPFHAEFTVPGAISLPSGNEERSLRLASEAIEPKLQHKAAPLLDPTAYLEASFTLKGDAPLLPGEVLLSRDGAFIGRARVHAIAGGDRVELGFGADERVKITRVPLQKEARDPGIFGSNRTEDHRFRTDIRNLHAFPVALQLLDRLPISEDQAITIERLPEMTRPDVENVEDRRGVVAWNLALAPQEAKAIVTAWRVRWPQGKVLLPQPVLR